jgi:hypothetical protein
MLLWIVSQGPLLTSLVPRFILTLVSLRLILLNEIARESISDLLVETRSATVKAGVVPTQQFANKPGSSVSTNFLGDWAF